MSCDDSIQDNRFAISTLWFRAVLCFRLNPHDCLYATVVTLSSLLIAVDILGAPQGHEIVVEYT
jgi:hypothetical protein